MIVSLGKGWGPLSPATLPRPPLLAQVKAGIPGTPGTPTCRESKFEANTFKFWLACSLSLNTSCLQGTCSQGLLFLALRTSARDGHVPKPTGITRWEETKTKAPSHTLFLTKAFCLEPSRKTMQPKPGETKNPPCFLLVLRHVQ